MTARGGLYWRLKDTSLSWADRVKLVRYAWKTPQICIPNKEQVLIDWIGLALAGKQRVPGEHSAEVWRCLTDVLSTQHAHERSSQGHHLVLKPALFQVVLEKLEKSVTEDYTPHHDVIISCAHSLLTSPNPHFNYTLISNFENIVRILRCSLQLCTQDLLHHRPVTQKFVLLLEASMLKCVARGNAQQAMQQCSSFLLPSALKFINVVSQENAPCGSLAVHVDKLIDLLNKLLFPAELYQYYEIYLRVKVEAEKKKKGTEQVPKFISNVFSGLFQQDLTPAITYLPSFYRGFVSAYRSEGKTLAFKLLVHIVDSLDLGSKRQGRYKPEVQLRALAVCLKEATNLEVYDPMGDLSSGGHQLKWFQKLTGHLIQMTQRSCDWYMSLQCLLTLSHSILEPQLSEVLAQAWLSTELLSADSNEAQGDFLADLASTYTKLRQIPRLVEYLLVTFRSGDVSESLRWPVQFKESLASSFSALPGTVCLEVWGVLHAELVQHYVPGPANHSESRESPEAVCDLVALFLGHIKVVDYSITLATKASVHQKLQEMATEILAPAMRHLVNHAAAEAGPFLYLIWSWGELYMLLAHYAHDLGEIGAALKAQALKSSFVDDLSVLHGYLSAEEWVKLHKALKKLRAPSIRYLWNLCLAQKLQACLLFGGSEVKVTLMKETTRALQVMTSDLDIKPKAVWDGTYQSVSEDVQLEAHWWLLSRCLNAVLPFSEGHEAADIARLVVLSLASEKHPCRRGEWTMRTISREVIGRSSFHESREMQTLIVTECWKQMAALLKISPPKSPKKRKTGEDVAMRKILSHLGDSEIDWSGNQADLVLELQKLKPVFKSLLTAETQPAALSTEALEGLVTFLKILDLLPLEYFTAVNRLRGILALIPVLKTSTEFASLETRQTFYKLGQQALVSLLVMAPGTDLFSVVDGSDLCGWLIELGCKVRVLQMPKLSQMLSDTLSSVVRLATKDLNSLEQLSVFVKKVAADVKVPAKQWQPSSEAWSVFQAAVITAQVLSKMLTKQSLKDDVRGACHDYCQLLQMSLLKLHKQFLSAPPEESPELLSLSLEGVSGMIDTAAREEEDLSVGKIGKILLPTCDLCLKLCSKHRDFYQCHKGPLAFIQSLSRSYTRAKDSCPVKFMQQTWKLMLSNLLWQQENRLPLPAAREGRLVEMQRKVIRDVLGDTEPINGAEQMDVDEPLPQAMEGEYAEDTSIEQEVLHTVARLISTFSTEEFLAAVVGLVETVDLSRSSMSAILVAAQVWSRLLDADLPEEQGKALQLASQNMLLRFLPVASELQHSLESSAATKLQVELFDCQTKMLSFGGTFLSPQCVSQCIHSCQYAALHRDNMTEFVPIVYAVYNVLNEALLQHSETIFKIIPPFVGAAKRLMLAVIQRSDQNQNSAAEDDLIGCAHLIDRLFSLIVTHKVEFARVAPYIIADYVNEVQKVTLLPKVKRALVPVVYRLFELCDYHSVALLKTNLAAGVKEVFRTLHDEYNKYYKYTGKI